MPLPKLEQFVESDSGPNLNGDIYINADTREGGKAAARGFTSELRSHNMD